MWREFRVMLRVSRFNGMLFLMNFYLAFLTIPFNIALDLPPVDWANIMNICLAYIVLDTMLIPEYEAQFDE